MMTIRFRNDTIINKCVPKHFMCTVIYNPLDVTAIRMLDLKNSVYTITYNYTYNYVSTLLKVVFPQMLIA